mmetsp:Transcript_67466/g.121575  ORF Transcript_67466/g.121575 Transcript_67466/m.121575 type:complete len:108 (+) Transcript_67466:202-525(+)
MRMSTKPGSAETSQELKAFHGATVVPQPAGLQPFKFSPGKAEREAGHRLAPCVPTRKMWLRRFDQERSDWEEPPSHLLGSIVSRRQDLGETMATEDAFFLKKFAPAA